tara:strand:- start:890 stop:1150 length:261 start_codon:yes stop_codon:yes gene_type:complete
VESDDDQNGYLREWPANLDDFDEMKRREIAEFIDNYHDISLKHHDLTGAVLGFIQLWKQRENRGVLEELQLRLDIIEKMVKNKGRE